MARNRSENVSKLTFDDIRALAAKESWDKKIIDGLDHFLGVAILLSPAIVGPAGTAALELLHPKEELIKLARAAVNRLASDPASDFLAKHQRLTAAYTLMFYTAFFEAVDSTSPHLAKAVALSSEERNIIAARSLELSSGGEGAPFSSPETALRLPHPALGPEAERALRIEQYGNMSRVYLNFAGGLAATEAPNTRTQQDLYQLSEKIPTIAADLFEAEYLQLLTENPGFHRWAEIYEFKKTRQLTEDLSTDMVERLERVTAVAEGLDVGLKNLSQLVESTSTSAVSSESVTEVVDALQAEYEDHIQQPVINDRYNQGDLSVPLAYPKKCDIFIPQAFRVLEYSDKRMKLEYEATWNALEEQQDLGLFVLRYLESAYSAELPLLVLGHPGSGKSLFTEMMAARLATPDYHPVRIALRDVDAESEIQDLIERQIKLDTGYELNWATFAKQLRESPPVIILDGYDELLQASGKVFGNYLDRIRSFQRREAVQGRPVRVIVTSRVTLIDKATVPLGATVIQLSDFDQLRRDMWMSVWNDTNSDYFTTMDLEPFAVGQDSRVMQLAAQPLLLLMLALFDSSGNQLRNTELDQTSLYDSLLRRFIVRERTKGQAAEEFTALTPGKRDELVDQDLQRLGIAAIGMFNRRSLHIQKEQLDQDIRYFQAAQPTREGYGAHLTQAELLLGSFFFIHESKSSNNDGDHLSPSSSFEFLHNTFGEFLTADFILRGVLSETQTIRRLSQEEDLLHMREARLKNLPYDWYARLIFTNIHSRPVVASMMREWLSHCLTSAGRTSGEFEEDLRVLVERQLADTLKGNSPPEIMQRIKESPFDSLPLLGHQAIYTLNLVLLLTLLARESVEIDERVLTARLTATRPWDRLINLWRSWISVDELTGLSAIMRARRRDHGIRLSRPVAAVAKDSSKLEDIVNVADAIADDVMFGLSVLHKADLLGEAVDGDGAQARLSLEGIDLSPLFQSRRVRQKDDEVPLESTLRRLAMRGAPSAHLPFDVVSCLEVLDSVHQSAHGAFQLSGYIPAGRIDEFVNLSAYEARLLIDVKRRLEPRWFEVLLREIEPTNARGGGNDSEIARLARSAALAPLLLAAREVPLSVGSRALADNLARALRNDDGLWRSLSSESIVALHLFGRTAHTSSLTDQSLAALQQRSAEKILAVRDQIMDEFLDSLMAPVRDRALEFVKTLANNIPDWVWDGSMKLEIPLQICRLMHAYNIDSGDVRRLLGMRRSFFGSYLTRRATTLAIRLSREVGSTEFFNLLTERHSDLPSSRRGDSTISLLLSAYENSWTLPEPSVRELSDLQWIVDREGDRKNNATLRRLKAGLSGLAD